MLFKRSLISELANTSGGVFTVLFTIVLAVSMVLILGMAAGGRIDNATILQMILYNTLTNLPVLLTLSLFVAVLMTLMRWWQENEMVVWFSSGSRSLLSLIRPVLRFSIPIVLFIAVLSVVIGPWARAQTEATRNQFAQRDDVNRIAPGRFIESMGGRRIFFIESAGENSTSVGRVFLAEKTKRGESVVTAASGNVEINAEGDRYIVLHDGSRYETELADATAPLTSRHVEFGEYGMRLDIKVDSPLESSKLSAQPISRLMEIGKPEELSQVFRRICWPLAALNLVLLAIPLSASNPRAGRSLNIVVATLIFLLYLNGISVMETWISQERFDWRVGLLLLNGSIFLLTVIFFIRQVYLQRWLPTWASFWYWRHRAAGKTGE